MKIIIPGEPQGKARARTVRCKNTVHSFTPEKTVLYENLVKTIYLREIAEFFGDSDNKIPLCVTILAYFSVPKSFSKAKRLDALNNIIRPTKKPDADNIAKVICDALNGVAYVDDTQVTELRVYKYYADVPRVEVEICENKQRI